MADTPEGLVVVTDTNVFHLTGRPCELSAFSHIPRDRLQCPSERTYFNSTRKNHYPASTYDRTLSHSLDYNNKLHRDDREHAKSRGLEVNKEEMGKAVPTLASSVYGHNLERHVDQPDRKHVRIGHVKSEFYRRNGIPSSGCDLCTPKP